MATIIQSVSQEQPPQRKEKKAGTQRETSGPWDMDAAAKGHRVWVDLGFLERKEGVASVTSDPWGPMEQQSTHTDGIRCHEGTLVQEVGSDGQHVRQPWGYSKGSTRQHGKWRAPVSLTGSSPNQPKSPDQGPFLWVSRNSQTSHIHPNLGATTGAKASLWELVDSPCLVGDRSSHQNELDPKYAPMRFFVSLCSWEWLRLFAQPCLHPY